MTDDQFFDTNETRDPAAREAALMAAKARLEAADVSVIGPTDHGIIKSIYFFDPNGIRLELTTRTATAKEMADHAAHAHEALAAWTGRDRTAAD